MFESPGCLAGRWTQLDDEQLTTSHEPPKTYYKQNNPKVVGLQLPLATPSGRLNPLYRGYRSPPGKFLQPRKCDLGQLRAKEFRAVGVGPRNCSLTCYHPGTLRHP